jgi:predicted transcriptional regulator of viral defense system
MDIKYKNISSASSKILTTFISKNKNWFTLRDAYALFPELSDVALRLQIKRMTDEGLLLRIKEGVFYIISYEQDSERFIPDWHLLAISIHVSINRNMPYEYYE